MTPEFPSSTRPVDEEVCLRVTAAGGGDRFGGFGSIFVGVLSVWFEVSVDEVVGRPSFGLLTGEAVESG